ncbi:MAG: hypothetical protein AAFZ10_15420, partial [Pseudomonadota bacterium]
LTKISIAASDAERRKKEAEANRLASPNTLSLQLMDGLRDTGVFDAVPDILNAISKSMEKSS